MKQVLYLLFPILALLCSCEDKDDYRFPSVLTDFVCITTDATGELETMILDNGNYYRVRITDELLEANGQKAPVYKRDTTYRAISIYELTTMKQGDTIADIYSIGSIISSIPMPLDEKEELHQDPVYLQSIWISGGYLNFVIEVKALNGKHGIGFVDTTPKGMHGKEFTFYHRVVNDVEAYRQDLYGSIPLAPFKDNLQAGDTLRFVVNTYDEGMKMNEFFF